MVVFLLSQRGDELWVVVLLRGLWRSFFLVKLFITHGGDPHNS